MPVASANGVQLYYEWHGAPGGVPVVLVMGLGSDSLAWLFQVSDLAPRHRLLLFDNRGVGRSGAPDEPYTTRGMAHDLLALLDGLGVERAHLVGLSLGGAIAQEAVLARPERFASLQLHATWAGPHPYFHALISAVRQVRRLLDPESFYRALSLWMFTPASFANRPEFIEFIVQQAVDQSYPVSYDAYVHQTEAAMAHDARGRLHRITCPTLVTVGSEDLVTPPALAEELARLIPGARLVRLPGAGHGAVWETPDAFNRVCLEFLEAASRSSADRAAG